MVHIRRKTVDFRMGTVLLLSGFVGSTAGIYVFELMKEAGQTELFVQLSYVFFMGAIGSMMFQESLRAILRARRHLAAGTTPPPARDKHTWVHRWPLKMKFRTSGLYISVIPPILIGLGVGFLSAAMGVGGGFIVVPAMIYILGMNTKVVVGTSLFQIIFVTAYSVMAHAITSQSVDMALAVLLIVGGVIGAQIGTIIGFRLKAEQLRILLAIIVLAVSLKIALDMVLTPSELYTVTTVGLR
ncbi:sulfite exporter TauE/SafE [mine drainage metagenome]|uniref:Sulfite exporter TauE/SafE n=1 Tax=mine drainage metagenome TaxID=410659 RepID=A0A1J5PZ61_9ZZZZ